jgi:hypothetical protein
MFLDPSLLGLFNGTRQRRLQKNPPGRPKRILVGGRLGWPATVGMDGGLCDCLGSVFTVTGF